MAVKWRSKCCACAFLLAAIQIVNGHEMYTISQLSPKSAHDERSPQDVLRTEPQNLAFRIEPSVSDELTPVESSRNPRSINIDEIAVNNNEIDNEVVHKRKYFIAPTKTMQHYEEAMLLSSGFGDKLDFKFPGEAKRAPKGRALTPTEPKVMPTAQPALREARQNTEIQNIITGIVKLLNGNVNVQANSQLLNGRPRPMASRINNRGPPRISEVQPEFDATHSFVPTKTPPPYPFDRPPVEQIPPRPFHRPIPPWQRRPRPPNRRPNPGLPMYKPVLEDKFELDRIPIEITTEKTGDVELTERTTEVVKEKTTEAPETSTQIQKLSEAEPTTVSTKTEKPKQNIVDKADTEVKPVIDKKDVIDKKEVAEKKDVTDKKDVTAKQDVKDKKGVADRKDAADRKDITNKKDVADRKDVTVRKDVSDRKDVTDRNDVTNKKNITDRNAVTDKKDVTDKNNVTDKKDVTNRNDVTDQKGVTDEKVTEKVVHDFDVIQPSITEVTIAATSTSSTEALGSASVGGIPKTDIIIEKTPINTQPIATSQGIPYQPYRPRPGIVLDDTDFKPHGTRHRDAPIITAPENLPSYGEIFDVTVSAIQGPGEKASVHIENINIHNDDIIVSPSGEQGFVSIDGKRTYLNLFDTTTSISPTIVQIQKQTVPPTATQLGTGVAVPADDVQAPIRRPVPRPQTFRRPHPTVRIDTCIVGDDSTCDQAQNEKCRTEAGISSCNCRPGYARRIHRDPCRRVVSLLLEMRVDRFYDRKVSWDVKLLDKDSEAYQQLSYEAIRAIDSAFSMTPFSDDFVSGSVNSIHKGEENQVFVNYTILMQETAETLRSAVATDIQKHILGVIRRRSNNVGTSALWVDSPAGSVLPLKDVDECSSPELNDCHKLATCTNTWGAFKCTCPDSTLDPAAATGRAGREGRECRECSSSHCNERGLCRYSNGQPYCSCSSGYYGSSCEVDGEVVGVAVGACLAAALVIALTLAALTAWSRKWSREQKAMGMGSPVFNYMAANTVKTPPVGQPPYQVTLEERMRWAQIAEAMAQANHYQPEPAQMATRPSSAMFGYPTLPPVPLPRMGLHGPMSTVTSRMNSSHLNLYGYTNHGATESTSSEASSHVQERADLLVPRPKSRARSMQNQTGIYYDVDYENAEPIYGAKGIPLSTYTVSRGPPFYR